MEAATITEFPTKDAWRRERMTGLGGSDSAAVLGLSPWKNATDVYMERVGLVDGPEENERMRWGTVLEEPIADEYRKRTGCKFCRLDNAIARHPQHNWMLASPDRLIYGTKKGLEVKTAGGRAAYATDEDGNPLWGDEGTDQVPIYYLMQCQHYLAVTGFEEWDLAVLIGGQDFRVYTIKPDKDLHANMIETLSQFWHEHVLAKVPPPAVDEKTRSRFLAARFPLNNGKFLKADASTPELMEKVRALKIARALTEQAELGELEASNTLKTLIAEYDGIEFEEVGKVQKITWKRSRDTTRTDWKAFAQSISPTPEQLSPFTTPQPGVRKLVVPRAWSASDKETAE